MVVTHLFQVLGFVAMKPPVSLSAKHLRDETVKVFGALKPIDVRHVLRGQYAGYRSEPGVAAGSQTETMAAVRAEVANWRWQGVPFFLRPGKAMATRRQVLTLGFHRPPLHMFRAHMPDAVCRSNEIVIDFADPGSISIEFLAKAPGPETRLGGTKMTFSYRDSLATANALEDYERLILLAMTGDQSLFTRSDGIERLWEISEPLLDGPAARRTLRTRLLGSAVRGPADRAVPVAPNQVNPVRVRGPRRIACSSCTGVSPSPRHPAPSGARVRARRARCVEPSRLSWRADIELTEHPGLS
jgi:glucose-6-phosphate 1-dehydrogenase